jgi:cell fate regulator YaaT (PSP1 superfamily)
MAKIVGVRFKPVGKVYYFNPGEFNIDKGDFVIVETARGLEIGEIAVGAHEISDNDISKPLKDIIRVATPADIKKREQNKEKEIQAYNVCVEKIKKHNLEMKLIEVEYTFDASKILFYFTADGRIDFRDLVKDLATIFKTRIELRQIGVRDESKTIGSIGVCGRSLCCSQFLGEFEPVSIKMAKEQGLSLNPAKISGACGRLMCCLKYEQDTYDELLKITPRQGAVVQTPAGKGTVEYVSLLQGVVKVKIDDEKEKALQEFKVSEVKVLKRPSRKPEKEKENFDEEILKSLE